MKIYISADIEGVTGITHWDEASSKHADYGPFRDQMTAEVAAACHGLLDGGATEIWIKDAHHTGRNLVAERLPEPIRLIRGWSGHPLCMLQELDGRFDALCLIGYHAWAGSGANPLAHTLTGKITWMKLNGQPVSELLLAALTARWAGVPLIFASGDAALCAAARAYDPAIVTVATQEGVGESTISLHPRRSVAAIEAGARQALAALAMRAQAPPPLATHFRLQIRYREAGDAYKCSFYPGAKLAADHEVALEVADFFEVLRALNFIT